MKNPFGSLRGGVAAWAALLAVLPGCGGDNAAPAGSCVGGNGKGTLSIKITGTTSFIGAVSVGGTEPVATDTDISLAAGSYEVAAARVAEATTGIARTAFEPSVDEPVPCVRAGQTTTVNVTFAPIATSGRLWVGLGSAPATATLLGYAAGSVAATGTVAAEIAANTGGAGGHLRSGGEPVGGRRLEPHGSARAGALPGRGARRVGATRSPDVIISSPSFGAGLPGAKALAFDASGEPVGLGRRRLQGRLLHPGFRLPPPAARPLPSRSPASRTRRASPSTPRVTSGWRRGRARRCCGSTRSG